MNKNVISLLLIIIAIGLYFSFTRVKIEELSQVKVVNAEYNKAIKDYQTLIEKRNATIEQYNSLSIEDRDRIEKLIPDNVDNVRLIIDINGVAARHGLALKDVKTETDGPSNSVANGELGGIEVNSGPGYNTASLSFKVKGSYQNFVSFLQDLEASLRIMDVSKITLLTPTDSTGTSYDYEVSIKTYWLKEIK